MKKIKVVLILCLATLVITLAAGCNLSDLLGGLNESPAPTQNDDEFEIEGVFTLTQITVEHQDPCDYTGDHNDNPPLAMLIFAYGNSTITFESTDEQSGTFTVTLSELAEENDSYFTVESGTYQIEDDTITLTDGSEEMELIIVDNNITLALPEIEITEGEHQGHIAIYTFVFTKE
jgi:hypothetical protein